MLSIALNIALAMLAVAVLLNGYRLLRGPSLPDRILALDTLYINAIGIVVLCGIRLGTSVYFELALLIAVLGFIGTVALAKYLLRGTVIE